MTASESIRVRGIVQGVGFRPAVWRLAQRFGIAGTVCNDAQGVLILAAGSAAALDAFAAALAAEAPPLARVDRIEREPARDPTPAAGFTILESRPGSMRTGIAADAASCADCVREVFDPFERRHRYAFTNCTHCGPRLSIVEAVPYDRSSTTMAGFTLCPACAAQFRDPADRRFHAQPIACPDCGPRAWLEHADGSRVGLEAPGAGDALEAAARMIRGGHIVAIKGTGGFQLACDAHDTTAVARLRAAKRRERKPFALMARDLAVIERYCRVEGVERALLASAESPVVLLDASGPAHVAPGVAPGLSTLGFMLPNSPLHHLVWAGIDRAVVLTSGNLADEPQCIDNGGARERLGAIADCFLAHDRGIARRVDDSVARVVHGAARLVRRARGYAPSPLPLPEGFERAPGVLAMGADLKNTFCLVRDGEAIVSHHIGDLENAAGRADYERNIEDFLRLFAHRPQRIAADLHPDYHSSRLGRDLAARHALPVAGIQHHHAHVAACIAENGVPADAGPVLGVALDGLGYGADRTLWGGEFLLADYRVCRRLACLRPVAMPGGVQAILEPWRNAYAHLAAAIGWQGLAEEFAGIGLVRFLEAKPLRAIDRMLATGVNSPLASSCGRLFDAVAAAAGICRERAYYEGQAAAELEAAVDRDALAGEPDELAYAFGLSRDPANALAVLEPAPLWRALLADLRDGVPAPLIAARFHKGLAIAIAGTAGSLVESLAGAGAPAPRRVALSGGVFQNRILHELVAGRLEKAGFQVLAHRQVPSGDGGISLGQALIAAARAIS